jgi:hypothetical protein
MVKHCFTVLAGLFPLMYGQSSIVGLSQDTRVPIMTHVFSAHGLQAGQQVDFQVADAVLCGNTIAIARSATVIGEIVRIHQNLFGRVDQLVVRLQFIPTVSGERIPLYMGRHIGRQTQIDWKIDVVGGSVVACLETTAYVSRDMQPVLAAPPTLDHPGEAHPVSLRPIVSR